MSMICLEGLSAAGLLSGWPAFTPSSNKHIHLQFESSLGGALYHCTYILGTAWMLHKTQDSAFVFLYYLEMCGRKKINEELSELNPWNYNKKKELCWLISCKHFKGVSWYTCWVNVSIPRWKQNSYRQFNRTKIQNSTWQYCWNFFFFSSIIFSK